MWRRSLRLPIASVFLVLPSCSLMEYFETRPQLCEPGDIRVRECDHPLGVQGRQERRCREDSTWSEWGDCEGGECIPEQVEYAPCEEVDGFATQQSRQCGYDGTWSEWGDCEGVVSCVVGDELRRERSCGPCAWGDRIYSCDHDGQWVFRGCTNNPFDEDEDGFSSEYCTDEVGPDRAECCGELDCNDRCPECFPGGTEVTGNDLDEDCSGIASDMDGDSHLAEDEGGDDCDDRDPRRWEHLTDLDGDGHAAAGCGGDDCDDDCASCYPGAPRICDDARDHDCDGVVDLLGQCETCIPGSPYEVGSTLESRVFTALFVSGRYAYVGDEVGFWVIDVSDPSSPEVVFESYDVGEVESIFVRGNLAYVGTASGLFVMDVSSPLSPTILHHPGWSSDDLMFEVYVSGRYAFVSSENLAWSPAFHVFDVSLPDRPVTVGYMGIGMEMTNFSYFEGLLFATGPSLEAIDVRDPTAPEIAGFFSRFEETFSDVAVDDGFAYVAGLEGFYVYDTSDLRRLPPMGILMTPGSWRSVFVSSGYAYAAGRALSVDGERYMMGLHVIDVSDPGNPSLVSSLQNVPVQDIFVSDGYAYLVGEYPRGFHVVSLDCGG